MKKDSKILVAGASGMVGSAISRGLLSKGYRNIVGTYYRNKPDFKGGIKLIKVDFRRQEEAEDVFESEKPEYVFLASAKVGGILANSTYKAEFIYDNLAIALNVVNSAYKVGVKKLLNLGSSCIYPKFAPQPLKEEYLLTGSLEPTNEPYAIAKIAAVKLCRYYNEQYGTNFISVMPTNLYGINDKFDLLNSHVLPALIRKFHLAKLAERGDFEGIKRDFLTYGSAEAVIGDKLVKITENSSNEEIKKILGFYGIVIEGEGEVFVKLWGTGNPYREFLYVDDLAEACIFLMERFNYSDIGEIINIGVGKDIKVRDLAELVKKIVGFEGDIRFDSSKPDGTPRKLLDVSKIRALGWKPKVSLETGIRITYRWYLSKLRKYLK